MTERLELRGELFVDLAEEITGSKPLEPCRQRAGCLGQTHLGIRFGARLHFGALALRTAAVFLRLGLQLRIADRRLTEDFDGACHDTDLVGTVGKLDRCVTIPVGERLHAARRRADHL